MSKNLFLSSMVAVATISMPSFASSNEILQALNNQGIEVELMSDESLGEARGAAWTLLTGQPMPSVTHGVRIHMVKWKKFGSKSDYSSYNYVGNYDLPDHHATNPNADPYGIEYQGTIYHYGGDQWVADDVTAGSAWSASVAYVKEEHYQLLNWPADTPSIYALRDSSWNRPISTFIW